MGTGMSTEISKEVSLPDLYKYALSQALQTGFILPENVIDRIHDGIIKELKSKCTVLVEKGLIREEDISKKLEYQVAAILHEAKRVNCTRRFALNAVKEKGLYCGISSVDDFEVLQGKDNGRVLTEIREWLCDLGTENNKFSSVVWGHWNIIGTQFDKVRDGLKIDSLLPSIFTGSKTSTKIDVVESIATGFDMLINPLQMHLYAHDPDTVEKTDEIQMSYQKVLCLFDERGISKRIRKFSESGTYIEFTFPCCREGYVNVTLNSDIEFNVTEELKVQTWAVILSLGINAAFNISKSRKFSHRMKLKVRIPDSKVVLRAPVKIEVSKAKVETFMELYEHFKKFVSALDPKQHNDATPALLPDVNILGMIDRYPWLQFIETLRNGGVDAAMEMVLKKPVVLRNLPANQNNVLGVAFEELQIAKIMAEAIRNNISLELIAGDGRGRFRYNGQEMATPEYTDAVFRNTITDEYFAVQFKYTDNVDNLIQMMTDWQSRWSGPSASENTNLPDAVKLENVQVIGPADVSEDMSTFDNLAADIRHNFEQNDRIGFKHPIDETETVKSFLDDNKNLLQDILNSQDYRRQQELKTDIKTIKNDLKTLRTQMENLNKRLKGVTLKKEAAMKEGKPIDGFNRGIKGLEGKIETCRSEISLKESSLKENSMNIKAIEENMRSRIEKNINSKYNEEHWKDAAWKEAKLNIAVQAAIDGITTFIFTCGDEWKKYQNGDVSFWELTKTVTIKTAIATGRGALIGAFFSSLTLAANYATAYEMSCAGALTFGSKLACPVFVAGVLLKQSYDILHQWKNGDITTAAMQKAFGRTLSSAGLSIAGMVASSVLIGGPLGLVVGAGLAIAVGVGDYFLGDKLWSCLFKENPEEALAVLERKINQFKDQVVQAAYDLFDLTEHATREEVKEKYRAAVRKYHPDRGGNAEIFHAVHAANEVICCARGLENVLYPSNAIF